MSVKIIKRNQIKEIRSVIIGEVEKNIGIHKDFRKHPELESFIPERARFSVAWVHLDPQQTLETHRHPTPSMIIVTEGQGELRGDLCCSIECGDVVIVPSECNHGFMGSGAHGFWGLSIQFEGDGLYENLDCPRVSFLEQDDGLVYEFSQKAIHFETRFSNSSIFKEIDRLYQKKDDFLMFLNFWSDWFQKILYLRLAFESNKDDLKVALQHMKEECGHNDSLREERDVLVEIWDPIIESCATWFLHKMMTCTSLQRSILMHCVIEKAGEIFYQKASTIFKDIHHFKVHAQEDVHHADLGFSLMIGKKIYRSDLTILEQGWQTMISLTDRIVDRALG